MEFRDGLCFARVLPRDFDSLVCRPVVVDVVLVLLEVDVLVEVDVLLELDVLVVEVDVVVLVELEVEVEVEVVTAIPRHITPS